MTIVNGRMTARCIKDKRGFYWVDDHGKYFANISTDRLCRFMHLGLEARFNYLLKRYLKVNDLRIPVNGAVLNFGAHAGEVCAAIVGTPMTGRIVAIEPDPKILPALTANAEMYGFEVVPVAAWNADGTIKLYLATDRGDSSVFNETAEAVTVPSRRIDTIVEEQGIDEVALIIGDAEGGEPEVLEGARETMKRTAVVSVCASAERRGEHTQRECVQLMTAAGLVIIRADEKSFRTTVGVRPDMLEANK